MERAFDEIFYPEGQGLCPKCGLAVVFHLSAPKGRPSKAQANGLGREGVPESSPEVATHGLRSYYAPAGLEAGKGTVSLTPSTQGVGLGFARPPLRGWGLQAETRFERGTLGQRSPWTLPNQGSG